MLDCTNQRKENTMLLRADSFLLKVLLFIASPSERLPSLIPLWIMPARVGRDYETFVKVTWGQPRR
jgi:hypothetical protein